VWRTGGEPPVECEEGSWGRHISGGLDFSVDNCAGVLDLWVAYLACVWRRLCVCASVLAAWGMLCLVAGLR